MSLTIDIAPRRQRRELTPIGHTENGWPHHSTLTPGLCICLDKCCNTPEGECKCKSCLCKFGLNHGEALPRRRNAKKVQHET
jgi:hypothetical protein